MGFTFADIYGHEYGHTTTRMGAIPEQADQEALQDDSVASADIQTNPASKRNMIIFIVVAVILMIVFSMN